MAPYDPIYLDCPQHETQSEGDTITGTVYLHPEIAAEKDVIAVHVALKAEIRTWVDDQQGQNSVTVRDRQSLLSIERVLWTSETGPVINPDKSRILIPLPFSFTIPPGVYPPSMFCRSARCGGSVRYYIHAVAERKSWFQRNTRQDSPFPFLPLDRTGATNIDTRNWAGSWASKHKVVEVRNNIFNIFSGTGLVDVTVRMPNLASIPLFKPIPIVLEVVCKSKLQSQSDSLDKSTFKSPRKPPLSALEISLQVVSVIKAGTHTSVRTDKSTLFKGSERVPEDFRVESTDPVWVPDEFNQNKGRWLESTTFYCPVVFRCPPPFETPLLQCKVNLHLEIDFPGIGNRWKATVGPLPISSGRNRSESKRRDEPPPELELPPSYWSVVHDEEGEKGDVKKKL